MPGPTLTREELIEVAAKAHLRSLVGDKHFNEQWKSFDWQKTCRDVAAPIVDALLAALSRAPATEELHG